MVCVGPQVKVPIEQACSSSSNSSECDLEEPMTASPTHSYDGAAPETYDVQIPHAHSHATARNQTEVGVVIVRATSSNMMSSWELDFSNVPMFRGVGSIAGRGCFDAFIVRLNQEFHFLAPFFRVTYLDASHSIQPLDTERDFAKALCAAVTNHEHNLNVFITESAPRHTNCTLPEPGLVAQPTPLMSYRAGAVVSRQAQAAMQQRLDCRPGGGRPGGGTQNQIIPKEELMQMLQGGKKDKKMKDKKMKKDYNCSSSSSSSDCGDMVEGSCQEMPEQRGTEHRASPTEPVLVCA